MRLNTNANTNTNRVMEPETISKNGASLKSQTSRGNFILFAVLAIIAGLLTFNSCAEEEQQQEPAKLEVSPTNLSFGADDSDYQTVYITSNGSWSASSSASWCNVPSSYSNYGDGSIRITVSKNTSTSSRNTTVVVQGQGLQRTINVSQLGTTTTGGTKPNTPTSVTASQSGSSVVVSWNSVSNATSYKVYRSSSASGTYSQIGSPSSASYTDSSPLSGYNYYKVAAVNSAGESDQSSYASCNYSGSSGTKPNTPTGVTASQSGSSVIVSWSSVSGATSYKVYRSSSASGTYSQVGTPSSTSYTDYSPLSGYNYYKVAAVNSAGESAQSSYVSVNFTQGAGSTPCPVTNLTASGSASSVNVSWSAPSTSAGCGAVANYDVHKRNPNSGSYEVKASNRTTTSWSDTDVHPGRNYYGVEAKNSNGKSAAMIAYTSEIPLTTPPTTVMNTISWGSANQTLNIFIVPQKHATYYIIWYCQTASGTYSRLGEVKDSERMAGYVNFNWKFPMSRGSTWYFKVQTQYEDNIGNRVTSSQSSYKSYTLP